MKRRETEYLCVQYSFMYMKVPNLTDGTNIVNIKYITVVAWLGNIFRTAKATCIISDKIHFANRTTNPRV